LCFAGAAIVGKKIFNGSLFSGRAALSPIVLTQARTSFTVLVLGPLLLARFGKRMFRISAADFRLCLAVGTMGGACANYFYYLAVQKATVSLAITVQYTAPVWVLLYMVLRGKEKAALQKTVAALAAMVGTALAIGVFHSDVRLSAVGVGAALVASFGYAFY